MPSSLVKMTNASLFISVLTLPGLASAQELSLADAVTQALTHNEALRQADLRLETKSDEAGAALGNFLPTISITGAYSHLDDPLIINLDPIRDGMIQLQSQNMTEFANSYTVMQGGAPLSAEQRAGLTSQNAAKLDAVMPHFEKTLKEQDSVTITLTAVQPLFTGGKLYAGLMAAKAEERAAQADKERTQNEVVREAINNYLAVALLNQVLEVRQAVLVGMQSHRDDALKLKATGLIAEVQVRRAEVAVAEAERALLDDSLKQELAMLSLKRTLGLPETAPLVVRERLSFHPYSTALADCLQEAQATQPLLKLVDAKALAVAQKVVASRAEFLPQVAAFGRYELYRKDLSALDPNWVVGAQLSINLFSGLKDYHRVSAAEHQAAEVASLRADTERSLSLWVNRAHRDAEGAASRFQKLDANRTLATDALRLSEERFHSGFGTSLEVVDARLAAQRIDVDRLLALFDYYRALSDLTVAMGHPERLVSLFAALEN